MQQCIFQCCLMHIEQWPAGPGTPRQAGFVLLCVSRCDVHCAVSPMNLSRQSCVDDFESKEHHGSPEDCSRGDAQPVSHHAVPW